MTSDTEIDDSLYSRQRYVLGDDAMRRLAGGNLIIFGLGGLGIEIAKNAVLSGIHNVTLVDNRSVTSNDIGLNFFVTREDVEKKRSRIESCLPRLQELNPGVTVQGISDWNWSVESDWRERLGHFTCVVLTDEIESVISAADAFCHSSGIPVIVADCFGFFGRIFADFGPNFTVLDVSGEDPKEFFIEFISQDQNAVVRTYNRTHHGLETGSYVEFKEIQGMEELNGKKLPIKVIDGCSFSIGSTLGYGEYKHGGIGIEVKMEKSISHECYAAQKRNPSIVNLDFGEEPKRISSLHAGVEALSIVGCRGFSRDSLNSTLMELEERSECDFDQKGNMITLIHFTKIKNDISHKVSAQQLL